MQRQASPQGESWTGVTPVLLLEVQPQRELNLTVGSDSDLIRNCRCRDSEVTAGIGSGERLPWLDRGTYRHCAVSERSTIWYPLRQPHVCGIGEIRLVQNVIDLSSEFQPRLLGNGELLAHRQIQLEELRSGKRVAARVPKRARRRY